MAKPKGCKIEAGQDIRLADWDPSDSSLFGGTKDEGQAQFRSLNAKLEALQERLYAEHKRKLLVVLQGVDTSGKDGTVRHVFNGINPQGVSICSFKKPTEHELERDYLWRVHRRVPRAGHIAIFNRSHYEDVLVPLVEKKMSAKEFARRSRQIADFERMLAEEGTSIVKFFLHIDAEEQERRLQSRLDRPDKHWKFQMSDFATRAKWSLYQYAYERVISATSTDCAPWYVVPANRKWYRNLVVSNVLVEQLEAMNPKFPPPPKGMSRLKIPPAK